MPNCLVFIKISSSKAIGAGYAEAEWITRGDLESSIEDAFEPTRSTESIDSSSVREAEGQLGPTREGTFEPKTMASTEHVVIIL